jgi:broad specificity phosphatase PhoE
VIVWLARHGEAEWPKGTALGWADPPLSRRGEDQARALAGRLAARPIATVYSSDLRRALVTAEAVAEELGLTVEVVPDLRELDFGQWEGRRLADLWQEVPDEARQWESDIRRTPSAFAESLAELEQRVAGFAGALRSACPGAADEVAVVAHLGSLTALHAVLSGSDVASSFRDLRFELGSEIRLQC